MQVYTWCKEFNPAVTVFVENVVFNDLADNWKEVEVTLGCKPIIVDAADFSFTRRRRAYWTNIELPVDFLKTRTPQDGDECMDEGRTLIRDFKSYGQDQGPYVRTIGKSWKDTPQGVVAFTGRPVLVQDESTGKVEHLRPEEAERLMGMPAACTEGSGKDQVSRQYCDCSALATGGT